MSCQITPTLPIPTSVWQLPALVQCGYTRMRGISNVKPNKQTKYVLGKDRYVVAET